jgi:hypothetical protein
MNQRSEQSRQADEHQQPGVWCDCISQLSIPVPRCDEDASLILDTNYPAYPTIIGQMLIRSGRNTQTYD